MSSVTLSHINESIEAGAVSAVRSHQSFEQPVEAVCHHSGRYLSRAEINPLRPGWLREQHEFPGLPELDQEFTEAAHAREHQHVIWNQPGVLGVTLVVCSVVLLAIVLSIWLVRDQVGAIIVSVLFTLSLILGGLTSVMLLLYGLWLFTRRSKLYHQQALGQPPALVDIPLRCAYAVDARERLHIDLGNTRSEPMEITEQTCALIVQVQPEAPMRQRYQAYHQVYQTHAVGQYVHAGVIALENTRAIRFDEHALEFGHRLPLRAPVPAALTQPHGDIPPLIFTVPYTLRPRSLYGTGDARRRAPIECLPELDPHDSYTLILRFRLQENLRLVARLEECKLHVPPELEPVERVVGGRYDVNHHMIVWRNVPFVSQELVLRITFGEPLLKVQPLLNGMYRCTFDGLLSGLSLNQDYIWNALGRRVSSQTTPQIRQLSQIDGDLLIDVRRLAQEHEYVCNYQKMYDLSPDNALVQSILDVFRRNKIDVLRIEQAAPRLDPIGKLDSQLWLWDLIGRRYETDSLNAFDVHVVVSGIAPLDPADMRPPQTQVDVHVRCLHDPRDTNAPLRSKNILDALQNALDTL